MSDEDADRSTDEQWRAELTPGQYRVLRRKRTEPPFIRGYVHPKADGMFRCAACGAALFTSETRCVATLPMQVGREIGCSRDAGFGGYWA